MEALEVSKQKQVTCIGKQKGSDLIVRFTEMKGQNMNLLISYFSARTNYAKGIYKKEND